MPNAPLFSPPTTALIAQLSAQPIQAVALIGPIGSGRATLATHLAGALLDVPGDSLISQPYYKQVSAEQGIDGIRELQRFAVLRVPQAAGRLVSRVAVITEADQLGAEGQNALLKLLEEPPTGMVLIVLAEHTKGLLPTIVSRVTAFQIMPPAIADLEGYFTDQGYPAADVSQAVRMAGGLPGATATLLAGDRDQPIYQAAEIARGLLAETTFERLARVDGLAKQRDLAGLVIAMMIRMADAALRQVAATPGPTTTERISRWQYIITVCLPAQERLQANGQVKLILTDLCLGL